METHHDPGIPAKSREKSGFSCLPSKMSRDNVQGRSVEQLTEWLVKYGVAPGPAERIAEAVCEAINGPSVTADLGALSAVCSASTGSVSAVVCVRKES